MQQSSWRSILFLPLLTTFGIFLYVALRYVFINLSVANSVIFITMLIGTVWFIYKTAKSALSGKFGLDYIALVAILTSIYTQEYLVGALIVLMLTTGEALEQYASLKAKNSLTKLIDRIPNEVLVQNSEDETQQQHKVKIQDVKIGQSIIVRTGEVIPLDGKLISKDALVDESSLTGEPYMLDKHTGDQVRSGTINVGNVIRIKITAVDKDSTYRKIIEMVRQAKDSQAPLIRLADRYSTFFTIATFAIAVFGYMYSGDAETVLAVLVVATPCPLIIAAPIALVGGMNASAKHKVIIKKLGSLEVLSRTNAVILDKTGTITLGHPTVREVQVIDQSYTEEKIYTIAGAIEHNSLHPFAKAIVIAAKDRGAPYIQAQDIEEKIAKGISATVEGVRYSLGKYSKSDHLSIGLYIDENSSEHKANLKKCIAAFFFEDKIKPDSVHSIQTLVKSGLELFMMTGDKPEVAHRLAQQLGEHNITVQASCTPEQKMQKIQELKQQHKITAMVGDGINDAPALAAADVGMVFSNEEQTAASEAADIVFLGGDFSLVLKTLFIAKRTIRIALQSIWIGISLSILSMIAAALGYIPPLFGSIWQEVIDVFVIVNALRASR